jgi:hypothetical protein
MPYSALLPALLLSIPSFAFPQDVVYPDEILAEASNPMVQEGMGSGVYLDGDWLYVVKNVGSSPGFFHDGTVMVYQRESGGWTFVQELTPPNHWLGGPWATQWFIWSYGWSILTIDDFVFVGAPGLQAPNTADGGIAVYKRGPQGHTLAQVIYDYPGRTPGSGLGVALGEHDGDLYSTIPAWREGGVPRGGVVSFEQVGGRWVHKDTYTFPGAGNLVVGLALAFDENRMLLTKSGFEAVVLEESNGQWSEVQRFDRGADQHGGRAIVSDDHGMVIFGDPQPGFGTIPGAARVFEWDGTQYVLTESIQASDFISVQGASVEGNKFGTSLSMSGDRLLVGAMLSSIDGTDAQGRGYLYERGASGWTEVMHFFLTPTYPFQGSTSRVGRSVALDEGVAIVGASSLASLTGVVEAGGALVYELPFGDSVCDGVPNSQGVPGQLFVYGYAYASAGALRLECEQLPANAFAIMLAGSAPGFVSMPGNSSGNLCISGSAARLGTTQALPSGHAELTIDPSTIPASVGGPIDPGDTFVFQCWYRDFGGPGTSNFTEAKTVTFR